ncbi:MAG: hypothetical protein HOK95_04225 [Candidatus Marinimicrobia bacterium]|jgi:hypothetical protein|nr:hypothetical protein [Candidatus Neomarinimicrobiota bacterium]
MPKKNDKPQNLLVMTGREEEQTPFGWDDMPEFIQEDNEAPLVLKIRFRNDKDIRDFADLIGQPQITNKTKSIWYPVLDRNRNSLLRWMDEDGEDAAKAEDATGATGRYD